MSTLPLSEVKARLSEIADEVDRTHERVHITRNGREYVVLLSAEDLESIEATLELLSDPQAMAEIREADAQVAAGQAIPGTAMAALMEQRRRRERRGPKQTHQAVPDRRIPPASLHIANFICSSHGWS